MCGIAGILFDGAQEREVDLMLAMISHRGPDEFGTYADEGICLGTARLSIVDIENGQQPLRDPATGVVVVFNGEIFNYRELREELRREGIRFQTHSDTEVVLNLYLKHGLSFAEHLNGQFAIGIWDPRNQRLLLARDRFGICPLFYHEDGGGLVFASEIKALFATSRVPRSLSAAAIDQVFTFWVPVVGTTAFSGVRELPPGHLLLCRPNAAVKLTPYWRWDFPGLREESDSISFDAAQEGLRAALSKAVSLRLRADIEVGSYLSGGIDSSALVALAMQQQPSGLRTFSVAFKEASYDESRYQKAVSAHCGTRHATVECDDTDIEAHFERAVWHAETPLFRTAPTPLFLLSRLVREAGIKVVLTGEGSDEVLLGYDLFREVKVRRFWQRRPESEMRPQLFKRLYAYLPQFSNPRYANLAIQSFKATLQSDSPFYSHLIRWNNSGANKVYFSEALQAALAGCDALSDLRATMPADFFAAGDVDRAQYLELVTLLRGYLLASQGDRMTMANSVEGRYPFLDHEFVRFANALPQRYKLSGLKDKYVLRQAFRGLLPAEICCRPKFAYQAPELRAFFPLGGTRSELVDEHLNPDALARTGLFKAKAVEALLNKVRVSDLTRLGTRDNMAFVQMLSTQILHRRFLSDDVSSMARARLPGLHVKTRLRMKPDLCNTNALSTSC
jgi:asparagine synthase (glutamine-hydrolysing)